MTFNPNKSVNESVMTQDEMQRLLSQPDDKTTLGLRDKTILELLYATGMRGGELILLTVGDVDWSRRVLTVHSVRGETGSRRVPVGEIAFDYLKLYMEFSRLKLTGKKETDVLFLTARGKPFDNSMLWKMVRGYAKQAGINRTITTHNIRTTVIVRYAEAHRKEKGKGCS